VETLAIQVERLTQAIPYQGDLQTAGIVSAEGCDIGSGPFDSYIQIDGPVTAATPADRPST